MSEKTDTILCVVLVIVTIITVITIVYHTIGMIDDHNCYMDGYRAPHCRKYIRGDE